ncbi:MAG: class I SAM-dependent methyltransferase [Chlamydiota bacterium]
MIYLTFVFLILSSVAFSKDDRRTDIDYKVTEGYVTNTQKAQFNARLQELPNIKSILEIGLNAGHSAENFFQNCPNLECFVSVDINLHPYTQHALEKLQARYQERFIPVIGDSTLKIPEYAVQHPKKKFDLIYIDGNHDYSYCLRDILNCFFVAHEETIVWIDDYNCIGAAEAINHCADLRVLEILKVHSSDISDRDERCWVEARYIK